MPENQERKRTFNDIALVVGVGTGMFTNVISMTKNFYEYGRQIAPDIQEYVGTIGAGAIKYGLPSFAFVGSIALGVLAVKATDYYRLYDPAREMRERLKSM